jgi:predicted outer membrane repeat protein
LYADNVTGLTLASVTFTGNRATGNGGGLYLTRTTNLLMEGSTIAGNTANEGAGLWQGSSSSVTLREVAVTSNSAAGTFGGGLYNSASTLTLTDVSLTANTAQNGGGLSQRSGAATNATRVLFSANAVSGSGGAAYVDGPAPLAVTDSVFDANTAGAYGGAVLVEDTAAVFTGVTFKGNRATGSGTTGRGGGLYVVCLGVPCVPLLTNVTFDGNYATYIGGGVTTSYSASARLTNTTFRANSTTTGSGGAMFVSYSTVEVTNSALWGNTPNHAVVGASGVLNATYTCVPGGLAGTGNVNLTADPHTRVASGQLFLNHVSAGQAATSACVDAGSDATADANFADWVNQTTRTDLVNDVTPVDMGRHHDPAEVMVATFGATATDAMWTTVNADECRLTNSADGSVVVVGPASLAAGSVAHGRASGVTLTLTCDGLPMSVRASATVP